MLDAFDDEVSRLQRLPSGEGSKVMAANYVAGQGDGQADEQKSNAY